MEDLGHSPWKWRRGHTNGFIEKSEIRKPYWAVVYFLPEPVVRVIKKLKLILIWLESLVIEPPVTQFTMKYKR